LSTITRRVTDFTAFRVGGQLVGTPQLYDAKANELLERNLEGATNRDFIRLPWVAFMMRPIALLPYGVAVWTWEALMLACLAAFAVIFPGSPRWMTAIAVCWSVAALNALLEGQDTELMLLLFGASILAYRRKLPCLSGLLLAFCTAKPHLILLVPLVLLIRKEWRGLLGFVATCAVLLATSYLVQGPDWPRQMLMALKRSHATDWIAIMPNLRGIFANSPILEVVASLVVVVAVVSIARTQGTETGLASALAGGVLIGQHAFSQDLLLAYPLSLMVMAGIPGVPRLAGLAVLLTSVLYVDPLSPLAGKIVAIAVFALLLSVSAPSGAPQRRQVNIGPDGD
jgi:hypothetical protein